MFVPVRFLTTKQSLCDKEQPLVLKVCEVSRVFLQGKRRKVIVSEGRRPVLWQGACHRAEALNKQREAREYHSFKNNYRINSENKFVM
eukprot:6477208-Amphidinium_carterae.1